jgi:hypothetical protein
MLRSGGGKNLVFASGIVFPFPSGKKKGAEYANANNYTNHSTEFVFASSLRLLVHALMKKGKKPNGYGTSQTPS